MSVSSLRVAAAEPRVGAGGLTSHLPPAYSPRSSSFDSRPQFHSPARASEQVWPYLNAEQQREVAPLLAAAQWHCQQWEQMRRIVQLLDQESYDGAFFRAVLSVHSEKQDEAQGWIDTARSALHPQFSTLGVRYSTPPLPTRRGHMYLIAGPCVFYSRNHVCVM